jgi:hypothetical protein
MNSENFSNQSDVETVPRLVEANEPSLRDSNDISEADSNPDADHQGQESSGVLAETSPGDFSTSLADKLREAAERRDEEGRNREFADVADIFAQESTSISMVTIYDEERNPDTSIIFAFDDINEINKLIHENGLQNIGLGLSDAELSAHVFVKEGEEGGGVVLRCPVSIGTLGTILSSGGELNQKLKSAYDKADGENFKEDSQKNRQLYDEIRDAVLAAGE